MTGEASLAQALARDGVGEEIYALAARLFPICRSITGPGVRETLSILGERIPLAWTEVPTGEQVFDWRIPREWSIREAWIKGPDGRRILDFADNNLHVLNYSAPVRRRVGLGELREHLFTLPDQPDLTPYRTSYYAERWGFCMPHRQFQALPDGEYEVLIDSTLAPGALTYAEHLHRGESDEEILLTAHVCHPSLANDNCSSLALLTCLAQALQGVRTRWSYRFLFAPGTIGAIAWLARNHSHVGRIRGGLVTSCVGDGGGPTYKRSRRGDAPVDRAAAHVLASKPGSEVIDFFPYGYDERQFCSPGFDLPMGLFQRSLFGRFPEYHTSADNLDFIRPEHLATSYAAIAAILDILETDRVLVRTDPYCEPQLGKYGLYSSVGGTQAGPDRQMALLWALNLADGRSSLLDMAERARMPYASLRDAAAALEACGLLRPA